jgi:hypothetical protein
VHVASASDSAPALAGRYRVTRGTLEFLPTYPLVRGLAYRVSSVRLAIDTTFSLPRAPSTHVAVVTAMFPSADTLPMNLLKLYIHFSAPMRAGEAERRVRLIDAAADTVIPDPFFRPQDERWDAAQTRLTVLFDPARIKRGLVPNAQLGLPLRAGRRYRLIVDREWPTADGGELDHEFTKEFTVVDPDRVAPDARTWSLRAPRSGTRDTLTIAFGEPMDQALVERVIVVRDAGGRPVTGVAHSDGRETLYRFVPDHAWSAESYSIDIDTRLEDVAGNNLRRLFDADLRRPGDSPRDVGDMVQLRFDARR